MRWFPIIPVLISACATSPAPDLASVEQALLQDWNDQDPDHPLTFVEAVPVSGEQDVYLAICDTQRQWWGTWTCFKFRDGFIEWSTGGDHDEQSIWKLRSVRVDGRPYPLIEVYGMTHMGNGCLYLYELRGRALHLLLQTRAVDSHQDLNLFRDGLLEVEYRDLNDDGLVDLEFTGIVDEFSDDGGDVPIGSRPCRKVFLWDGGSARFVEDRTQRTGFEGYSDD